MGQVFSFYGVLALLVGYLLGSIPFGLVLTRAAGVGDVREIGSGSIGATNVLRTGRKDLAAATLLLDALKGTLAVMMVYDVSLRLGGHVPDALNYSQIAGLGALLGHIFPVWLRFQGGKGVATFIGVLVGMYWVAAAWFGLVWLGVAAATRYSSLAALCATAGVVLFYIVTGWAGLPYILAMAVLIFLKHHENIRRLREGRESKIGART
ncbi:MAG TPA: glycerol-3-phosphate 1-O-acyltransferase PlsY [Hyphomicrobiaceae bacterium]|jgi:glycerol-3-phosphate acyltransferase PlsY